MADTTRAVELVQTIERDEAFRAEVEAAPTITAKRAVLDAHGFQDVGLEEMRAYVASQGGTLTLLAGGQELSEQELAAVAGGQTADEVGHAVAAGVSAGLVGGGLVVTAAV